jgi:hypothetical protein
MADNPLSIQYTNGTLAAPLIQDTVSGAINPAFKGVGVDASANQPPLLSNVLKTGVIIHAGQLYVQNQSNVVLQLVLYTTEGAYTVILLEPAIANNRGGGDLYLMAKMPWFVGEFQILGPSSSSQVAANFN